MKTLVKMKPHDVGSISRIYRVRTALRIKMDRIADKKIGKNMMRRFAHAETLSNISHIFFTTLMQTRIFNKNDET